jgi:hypothetical protein
LAFQAVPSWVIGADEFRRALAQLDLSIYGSAAALGLSVTTVHCYARGDRAIPEHVAKLVRALVKLGVSARNQSRRTR